MNAKQRFDKAVLEGGLATTVCDGSTWVARHNQVSFAQMFEMEDKGASLVVQAAKDWGSDLVWASLGGFGPIAQGAGAKMNFDKVGEPGEIVEYILSDIEESAQLDKTDEEIREMLESDPGVAAQIIQTRKIKELVGDEMNIACSNTGPFTLAAQMLGVEDFMVACFDEELEEHVHRLVDYAKRVVMVYGDIMLDEGVDVMLLADPVSSPDMIGPEMFENYSLPALREATNHFKKRAKFTVIHICGDTTSRLEPLRTIEGLDIFSFDRIEIQTALEKSRGYYKLLGNLHTVDVLTNGTPELCCQKVDEIVDSLQAGDTFIIAPGCDMPPVAPLENIQAMTSRTKERSEG